MRKLRLLNREMANTQRTSPAILEFPMATMHLPDRDELECEETLNGSRDANLRFAQLEMRL